MLVTFPNALNSQAATYHGFFPNGNFPNVQLSKCATFQMCNFPNVQLSKCATSQMCNFPNVQYPTRQLLKWRLLKSVLAAALGPQHILASAFGHPLHRAGPQMNLKLHIWEVALGKRPLEKNLTPSLRYSTND